MTGKERREREKREREKRYPAQDYALGFFVIIAQTHLARAVNSDNVRSFYYHRRCSLVSSLSRSRLLLAQIQNSSFS